MHKLYKNASCFLGVLYKQSFKLIPGNLLFFKQELRAGIQHLPVGIDQFSGFGIALVHNPLYFFINLTGHLLAIASCMRQVPADEDFLIIAAVIDQTDFLRHTVFCNH